VAQRYPLRLVAVATVTWPAELWWTGAPPHAAMPAGRRVLTRARRRLGLPRWCPVAVVAGPSLSAGAPDPSAGTPDWVSPHNAELLARAGLVVGWVIAPDRAEALRAGTPVAVAAELAAAMAGVEAELAVGAAIAILLPPDSGTGVPGVAPAAGAGSTVDRVGGPGVGAVARPEVRVDAGAGRVDRVDAGGRRGGLETAEPGVEGVGGWAVQPAEP
jgi:hypothetical protein